MFHCNCSQYNLMADAHATSYWVVVG